MKHIRYAICLTALVAGFVAPAGAVDGALAAKKAPVARDAGRRAAVAAPEPSVDDGEVLTAQVVYQVLLAEVAMQRGDLDLASQAYATLALRTRDPQVLERMIEVAGYARRFDLAIEAARLWLEREPDSKRAQQLLISMMILSNRLDDLAPPLIRLLEADTPGLAANLTGLNRMFARSPDRLAVFRLIEAVCRPFIGMAEAHYAVAVAAGSAGLNERAMSEVRRSLELRPGWELPAYLGGQLLARESPGDAIEFMQEFVERYPQAREVHLLLARTLVAEKRYYEAKRHFDQLLQANSESPEITYAVAVLALQQNDRGLAEAQFKRFLSFEGANKSVAYYYLGQIAEDDKRFDEALAHYAEVESGEHYLPARMRSAYLLGRLGRIDEARTLLDQATTKTQEERIQLLVAEAALLRDAKQLQAAFALLDWELEKSPEQADLLYETGLLAERLGRFELMEARLRKLIGLRPDNVRSAQAYNALGYSYAERNIRLGEARELIEKALLLSPEDGFILDSMGWVLFRQGDLNGALGYLEKAYAQREDPEIAAHIGEVLWALGRQEDARRVLLDAGRKHPDSDVLNEAVRKFAP
ncbi:tetratricopeptide repeat protein [Propionivibrio limicola]|uniref:tetratricopeptide repeat protein n=1 Tax=Propionivibrio limicola TaxID=167645 RepID=UPI00129297EA|nr:tetratricopeptide repeat protein [Propionivibrio limicola]